MNLDIIDLGLIEYDRAWKLQDEYAAEIAAGTRSPTLLLLEHAHVFTFGRRGEAKNLLWSPEELARRGVGVHWVDRGGDVAYHGPGQLVGYPLIPLEPIKPDRSPAEFSGVEDSPKIPVRFETDYVGYIRKLERTLIAAMTRFGLVTAQRSGLTGVWVQADVHSRCARCLPEDKLKPAKIAAIGVKVDARGVSRHGFALNVNPDMEYFDGIIACGLIDHPVTSLADLLSTPPSMDEVKAEVKNAFCNEFGYEGVTEKS